jgi:hypothetical protein
VSQVLGKIMPAAPDEGRGPDGVHKVRVLKDWLCQGATVDVELPRNLHCAQCRGGGCDRCERSGAITLRSKQEPAEVVTLTLPYDQGEDDRGVIVRVPEFGGFATEQDGPRGLLLLRIIGAEASDESVRLSSESLEPAVADVIAIDPALVKRSAALAAALIMLFLLMLYLSGWL